MRDLHDRAQQRLAHAVVALKLAQRAFNAERGRAEALLAEALDHAERGNAELRELAGGRCRWMVGPGTATTNPEVTECPHTGSCPRS